MKKSPLSPTQPAAPAREIARARALWDGLRWGGARPGFCASTREAVRLDGTARDLDGTLRNVGRLRAVLEREIGRRLARLRESRGLIRLGFSSLGDYGAERLEVSRRTAQEMARTGGALERLPALRQANDEGRLSSSHIRELVGVAEPRSEKAWVERASGLSVRDLRAVVSKHKKAEERMHGARDASEPGCGVTVKLQAPAGFRAKWAAAVELFRKVAGRQDLPEGHAAEAFAAEYLSGAPPVPEAGEGPEPAWETPPEPPVVYAPREWKARRWEVEDDLQEEHRGWVHLDEGREGPPPLPEWVGDYAGPLSPNPFVLDREIREMEASRRELDGLTGRIFFVMARYDMFRSLGFADLGHYARERVGLAPSTARKLHATERKLFDLPEVRDAWHGGAMGLGKVSLLLRVAGAKDMAAWVERAKGITVRRLEDEVRTVIQRADLVAAGVVALGEGEDPLGVLPEALNLKRYTSALDGEAREAGKRDGVGLGPTVTLRWSMEWDAEELWDTAVDHCRAVEGVELAEWECADRFLDAFFAEYLRDDPLKYALNHKVIARDDFRCTVPGCSSRCMLESHHQHYRSRGGSDAMANQTGTCWAHHKEGVHKGTIRVEGEAPDHLTWSLGERAGRNPLMIVGPGERVLKGGGLPRPRR